MPGNYDAKLDRLERMLQEGRLRPAPQIFVLARPGGGLIARHEHIQTDQHGRWIRRVHKGYLRGDNADDLRAQIRRIYGRNPPLVFWGVDEIME